MVNYLNGVKCTFLSFLCGIVISKFVKKKHISFLAAIVIGTLIGILGAFGVFGVVYPFFIAVDTDAFWYDEVTPFGLFFMIPQIKIYSFVSGWLSASIPLIPIVAVILVITSIASVLIGQLAERRWFGRIKILE